MPSMSARTAKTSKIMPPTWPAADCRRSLCLRRNALRGATSVLRHARGKANASRWLIGLLARRPFKVAAVALANKMARIIWALLVKGGIYRKVEAMSPASA
jgi:transposase